MSQLLISTNETVPRVSERATFYFVDYEIPGPLVARMLALQNVTDFFNAALRGLSERRLDNKTAQSIVEEVWAEAEATFRRLAGESAAETQKPLASAAPTSAPSDGNSTASASSTSTKPKASNSTSRPAKSTSAKPAAKTA